MHRQVFIMLTSQRAHDVKMTSYQRRCDVMTSHRRRSDVILTSCACWVVTIIISDLKKTMAVLLENILERIDRIEKRLNITSNHTLKTENTGGDRPKQAQGR